MVEGVQTADPVALASRMTDAEWLRGMEEAFGPEPELYVNKLHVQIRSRLHWASVALARHGYPVQGRQAAANWLKAPGAELVQAADDAIAAAEAGDAAALPKLAALRAVLQHRFADLELGYALGPFLAEPSGCERSAATNDD